MPLDLHLYQPGFKYFIGLQLPPQIAKQIDVWRGQYYPFGLSTVPPHITVISPFIPDKSIEILNTKVEQSLKSVDRFEILIKSFGYFSQHSNVFFANVVLSSELEALHRTIRQSLMEVEGLSIDWTQARPYRPHVTIANKMSQDQLDSMIHLFQGLSFEHQFSVETVSLFQKVDGKYEAVRDWPLGNAGE